MASSNRHWPSLFKSKPHHQWQHDHSSLLSPSPSQKPNSYSSSSSGEERSPEPKPRWNPKPEQIRILEAIFNSGMVNPPREEIRRIRAQLQEYGQVGDANVFYWFQNRKSRSKNKLRSSSSSSSAAATRTHAHAQSRGGSSAALLPPPVMSLPPVTAPVTVALTSSSSSSSERSTGGSDKILPPPMSTVVATSHSPNGSVNQTYLLSPSTTSELFVEPEAVYLQASNQGFYVSSAAAAMAAGELMPAGFWTEMMMGQELWRGGGVHDLENSTCTKMQNPNPNLNHNGCGGVTGTATTAAATSVTVTAGMAAHVNGIVQGEMGGEVGGGGGNGCSVTAKSTVFINGVGFEVGLGPVNVREAFGDEAVLIHCSGHPVLTDDWGLTLQPLQHGASYYLI